MKQTIDSQTDQPSLVLTITQHRARVLNDSQKCCFEEFSSKICWLINGHHHVRCKFSSWTITLNARHVRKIIICLWSAELNWPRSGCVICVCKQTTVSCVVIMGLAGRYWNSFICQIVHKPSFFKLVYLYGEQFWLLRSCCSGKTAEKF